MTGTRCETVRLWLQAPDELKPEQSRKLNEHLDGCGECRLRRQQYRDVDIRLWAEMDAVRMPQSARVRVLRQIALQGTTPGGVLSSRLDVRWTLRPIRSLLVRLVVYVPAAALTVALALGFPRGLPESGSLLDAGAAWHAQPPIVQYRLAIDSSSPNHLLAGAAGQVYESWNAGDTWHRLAALPRGLTVRALLIDRAHPNRYLVATDHSIFDSADRGKHWRLTAHSMPGAYNMFLLQDARDPATIYVGPSILWKSTNSGETWAPAGRGTVFAPWGIQTLKNGPGRSLYTGIWGGGVAVSRNGGVTWQRRARGIAPHVIGLSVAPAGTVWAATDRGIYRIADGRQTWRHAGPRRFYATTVLATRQFVLAGGNHAVYRSDDGGKSWKLSMEGLPLDPYVYDLEADPLVRGRVYAVLTGDALFRSDDEGRHWTPIDTGIPLSAGSQSTDLVLFLRDGAVWHTDSQGTDPGVSTVETDVRIATPAPDNTSLAYLASFGSQWWVRVMSPSGSGAQAIAAGSSDIPTMLSWSPSSALLAIVRRSDILVTIVTSVRHLKQEWRTAADDHFLGWAPGGGALLFWNAGTGQITHRSWQTGVVDTSRPNGAHYPALPAISADGSHLAYIWEKRLYVGGLNQVARQVASVPTSCSHVTWSNVGTRILLTCSGGALEMSAAGAVVASLPGAGFAEWAPGSKSDVLYFRLGALWKRTGGGRTVQLARPAAPTSAPSVSQ